jgi:hypothetical protein
MKKVNNIFIYVYVSASQCLACDEPANTLYYLLVGNTFGLLNRYNIYWRAFLCCLTIHKLDTQSPFPEWKMHQNILSKMN